MRSLARRTPESPTHVIGTWLFLRILGLAHLFAFGSLALQIHGLLGADGILPAADYLAAADQRLGADARWWIPTLFWLSASDSALTAAMLVGVIVAVGLTVGVAERWSIVLLWVLYLSVCGVGQAFLAFQWDILLLEASAVGALVASPRLFCGLQHRPDASRVAQFVLRLLLVKLLVSSGWVKLASGDPHWANGTAMNYHYETQPLPTWVGWWAHQLPALWHRFESIAVLIIQVGVTPLALTPWRGWAFVPLVGLQLFIAVTGNYCFFNLLTVGLGTTLLCDHTYVRSWRWAAPAGLRDRLKVELTAATPVGWKANVARGVAAAVAGLVAIPLVATLAPAMVPGPVERLNRELRPLRTFNSYGLFAVMTTERVEIEVEGSLDGVEWQPYRFVAKPGPLDRAPSFIAPFQPRLDWQMWFAALGRAENNPWFGRLMLRLLRGSPDVGRLFERVPFGGRPPRYVRALRYRYRFTSTKEASQSGHWWTRERLKDYFPTVSLSGTVHGDP